MSSVTVGSYLLSALKGLGIKRIYGIPGDMIIDFFKLIEDDKDLELSTFCHEPGVGFAAAGEARGTRRPAVACITFGPGGLNMMNAVGDAYAEKTPLIVVSGGPPRRKRIAKDVWLHHMVKGSDSQLLAYRHITAQAVVLDSPDTASLRIERALTTCRELTLPVYIELPVDMIEEKIEKPTVQTSKLQFDAGAVKEAADEILMRISIAKKPVVMAGEEAEYFGLQQAALNLARRWNVAVVTSLLGRDVIPQEDPLYFGTYMGQAGNSAANQLVEESDCLVLLGAVLTDVNLGIKLRQTKKDQIILCVSQRVKTPTRTYAHVPLKQLIPELTTRIMQPKNYLFPEKPKLNINRACKNAAQRINSNEVIDALNWFFSEYGEMPIISDTGNSLFVTLGVKAPLVIAPAFYSGMGFSVPAGIGYQLGSGNRPLIIVGDGSFQMTGQEISQCPKFEINPIVVVLNNSRWGMEQIFSPNSHFNELVNWPYAKMAELWGGKGYYCDDCDKLYQALREVKNEQKFSLIEVVMPKEELSEQMQLWMNEAKQYMHG